MPVRFTLGLRQVWSVQSGYADVMSRVKIAIAVAEEQRDFLHEIAASCRALGFTHTTTLAEIGLFLGSAELHDLPRLAAVPGVVAVERQAP